MTSDRGDGRDAKGRWVKKISGNPNGRPPDVPDLDMADLYNFSQYPEEITIRGKKHIMTRHEIVLFKLFESAIKGNITSQKILLEKFEQAELSKEYVRLWLVKWAERIGVDPDSEPQGIVHMMKRALDSQGPRLSKIRARKGGKRNWK